MKLYKAVLAKDLEDATRNGWQLTTFRDRRSETVAAPHTERRIVESDPYNGKPHLREFGDVLVFVVWKDSEFASREAELQTQLRTLNAEASAHRVAMHEREQLVKAKAEVDAQLAERSKALNNERAAHGRTVDAARDKNRKLEADLAKVRAAIGELKWKEIVD